MAWAPAVIGTAISVGTSIASAVMKPKEPKSPGRIAAKDVVTQKQAAARAQGLSSLILTRNRAPLGVPGNTTTPSA